MNKSFFSEDLNKAIIEAKPILDNINTIKDNISNDIKSLEVYLKSLKIDEYFIFYISEFMFNPEFPQLNLQEELTDSDIEIEEDSSNILHSEYPNLPKFIVRRESIRG